MSILPKRILFFGYPGSGKSTAAKLINKRFNIPLYHLDKFFFVSDWKERKSEEFLAILNKLVSEDEWLIDGNAIYTFEPRFKRADLIVYFKLPRLLCLWRIFKRYFTKDKTIDDRADGCPEKISWKLISYLWTFDERVTPILADLKNRYPHVPFIILKSDKEVHDFLTSFEIIKK